MDWLDKFAAKTLQTLKKRYYEVKELSIARRSLAHAIINSEKIPVIAELKLASPAGMIINTNAKKIIESYSSSEVAAISVLTEPFFFKGSLENLKLAVLSGKPVLMKDFLLAKKQIIAAQKLRASAVLLILELFKRGYSEVSLEDMIEDAHKRKLEVVLEVSSKKEYEEALSTQADIIGINNRDLRTLNIELKRTEKILRAAKKIKPVISMSGISKKEEIINLKKAGADAFIIGTALLTAKNITLKLQEFIIEK